ncbi:hypothetical protein J6590_049703 [Homalodisca vitripennis]|nr:hypothetical protein J6590_049703 [Homalodisca vitripennis]
MIFKLHHGYFPRNTSFVVIIYPTQNKTPLVPQPHYSPDIALCDFVMFHRLKRELKGKHWELAGDSESEETGPGASVSLGPGPGSVIDSPTQQHEQMFVSFALFTHGDACILSSVKDDELEEHIQEQVRRHSLVRTRTFFIVQFNVQHAGRQKITTRNIAQVRILPLTAALFISTKYLEQNRLSPLFCFIRSSDRLRGTCRRKPTNPLKIRKDVARALRRGKISHEYFRSYGEAGDGMATKRVVAVAEEDVILIRELSEAIGDWFLRPRDPRYLEKSRMTPEEM